MILQPIVDIAEICVRKNVKHVIISPGSRNAALTLAFARHPQIATKVVSDERSAAFIALGMADQLNQAVALICTSGSAGYNYAPAIAESFYRQIPLLIFTADRPIEWIGQFDGQTIQQSSLYGDHVKESFNFPQDFHHSDSKWFANRTVQDAINLALELPKGPVHINVPIREPFYPENEEVIEYSQDLTIIDQTTQAFMLGEKVINGLSEELKNYQRIIIVAGQQGIDEEMLMALEQFSLAHHIPVITDIISNCGRLNNAIVYQDLMLSHVLEDQLADLKPDLVISFGLSVLSKNLKLFLRKLPNLAHWHIQPVAKVADTFQHLSKIIRTDATTFFSKVKQQNAVNEEGQVSFLKAWKSLDHKVGESIEKTSTGELFNEFIGVREALKLLPNDSILHVANSMPVRYANYLGVQGKDIEVFANRGTSGIDGCTSTAIGAALATEKLVTLITGDMAFFYDRNAFWNKYDKGNLRVILLNNQGGGIFGIISGPNAQPELEEYFITEQPLNASNLCQEFNIAYARCTNHGELMQALHTFFEPSSNAKIIELDTVREENEQFLKKIINQIKEI